MRILDQRLRVLPSRAMVKMIEWKSRLALLFALLIVTGSASQAGDAVAIGYNAAGVWTAVTYYCSSTPPGGADYKDEAGAREAALRDLQRRAGEGVVTTKIIAASDRTGHFAYARAKSRSGEDLHAVGFGPNKAEAEQSALRELRQTGGTRNAKVIYNYFSHGAEAVPADAARRR